VKEASKTEGAVASPVGRKFRNLTSGIIRGFWHFDYSSRKGN